MVVEPARQDTELLEIELTERLLLEENAQTSRCLSDLQEIGVRIALDDFGTGYSALTYLNRFPLDVVKMDRDLLQDIESSEAALGIVGAVISMSPRGVVKRYSMPRCGNSTSRLTRPSPAV